MARLTASGAPSGAAAWPKRRRARVPGTVGPEAGKGFAFADDTIAAKTVAPTRILGLRGYTHRFGACPMPQEPALPRTKSSYPRSINMQDLCLLRAKAHPNSRLIAMLRIPLAPAADNNGHDHDHSPGHHRTRFRHVSSFYPHFPERGGESSPEPCLFIISVGLSNRDINDSDESNRSNR